MYPGSGSCHDFIVRGSPAITCDMTPQAITMVLFEDKDQINSISIIREKLIHSFLLHSTFLNFNKNREIKVEPIIEANNIKDDLPFSLNVGISKSTSNISHIAHVKKLCPFPLFFLIAL